MGEAVVFWIFAVMALGSGIAVIAMRNIVHGALMLVVNLLSIAALYVALGSQFLGIIQILVYAGAIMVLFLFVIMLLGVDRDDRLVDAAPRHRIGAIVGAVLLAGGLLFAFSGAFGSDARCGNDEAAASAFQCQGLEQAIEGNDTGSVGFLAERMFTRWTFPFEAAALLLVVATIGALVLGRRADPPRGSPATDAVTGEPAPDVDATDEGAPDEDATERGAPSDAHRLLPEREEG